MYKNTYIRDIISMEILDMEIIDGYRGFQNLMLDFLNNNVFAIYKNKDIASA